MSIAKEIPPAPDFYRSLFVDYFVDEANRRLIFKLLKLSRFYVDHTCRMDKHLHWWYELIIPFDGSYRCTLNGSTLSVGAGEALLIQPGDTHSDTYQADSELMFLVFRIKDMYGLEWTDHVITREAPPTSRVINVSNNPEIDAIINLAMRHRQNNASDLVALSKICEVILWDVIALIPVEYLSKGFLKILQNDQFVVLTENYFQNHITGTLDIKDFCRNMGMCRRAVEKKFLEVFNTSPHKMFTELKMKLAIEMLNSGSSIKETADWFGFRDQFYFSTVFKRVNGYPPSSHNVD